MKPTRAQELADKVLQYFYVQEKYWKSEQNTPTRRRLYREMKQLEEYLKKESNNLVYGRKTIDYKPPFTEEHTINE